MALAQKTERALFLSANTIATVERWVQNLVVAKNLCPFAKRELLNDRVRFTVSNATTEEELLQGLKTELQLLANNPAIETTLLIHPQVLQDFSDYNQFLGDAEQLLTQIDLEGVFQIASFHPNYQFAGTASDDAENYTNRAPYPLLHLLREDSLEKAIAGHPDAAEIPTRNIATMNNLGSSALRDLLQACFHDGADQQQQ